MSKGQSYTPTSITRAQHSLNLGSSLITLIDDWFRATRIEMNGNILPLHYTFPLIVNGNCVVLSIMDFMDTQRQAQNISLGFSSTVHQIKKGGEGTTSPPNRHFWLTKCNGIKFTDMLKSVLSLWTCRIRLRKWDIHAGGYNFRVFEFSMQSLQFKLEVCSTACIEEK